MDDSAPPPVRLSAGLSSLRQSPVADLAVSLAGGAAFALAFVFPALWPLALAAPIALFHVALKASPGRAGAFGAMFGLSAGAAGLFWVTAVTWLGWAGLATFVSLHFAAAGLLTSWLSRVRLGRTGDVRLPVAAVGPAAWVAAEFSRAHLLTGFPWLFLGHALADVPVAIQVADLGGAYAASFVWALPAAALADVLAGWRLRPRSSLPLPACDPQWSSAESQASGCLRIRPAIISACVVVAGSLLYGACRLSTTATRDGPSLVLVQGNIHTPRASDSDTAMAEVDDEIWRVHEKLTREHAARGDLVVWSESMLPGWFNDPDDASCARWRTALARLLADCGKPLLTGGNALGLHHQVPATAPRLPPTPSGRFEYNSAFLIELRDGRCSIEGRYDKMHLVPFGEYVPLPRWPLLSGLTPYAAGDPGYSHGDRRQPLVRFQSLKLGILICYESAFAYLSRRAEALGADMLVNLSSEAWFAGTSEIPQLARITRFRAVETGLPMVRCCNVGVTAVIDPAGRVVAMLDGSELPTGARGVLIAKVPLRASPSRSVYAVVGDLFAWLCAAWVLGLAALGLVKRARARRGIPEGGVAR
jgi:apolipoprotein N-acyltransferase